MNLKIAGAFSLTLFLTGCRCKGGHVDPAKLGFRAETSEVDFGRVLEGDTATMKITLVGTGTLDVTVTAQTDAPFSVPSEVQVPGGASVDFEVQFQAGNTAAMGEVRLLTSGETATVALKGVGVRPKSCIASAPCRLSMYSF